MKYYVKLFAFMFIASIIITFSACSTAADTTTDTIPQVTTTTVPELEVDVITPVFTPGDYSGTITWDAVDGATGYDVYMKYADAIGDLKLVAENITETTYNAVLDYGRTTEFQIMAHGTWFGADAIIAQSEIFTGKPNGVRANEFAVHDNVMRYTSPQIFHAGCGIIWINGEVWISDGGNHGDATNLINILKGIRTDFLGEYAQQYETDENCKLAVNIYITHYHGDHTNALINALLPNRLFAVEDVYAAQPETDPARRPYEYAIFHSTHEIYYANTNSVLIEVPFSTHINLPFENSTAVVDFYTALFDWSVEYKTAAGDDDRSRGWYCMIMHKGLNNALTLAQNCNSMWAKYTYEDTTLLFTGDTYDHEYTILRPMLEYYGEENFDIDVLVYLHHGHTRYAPYLMEVSTPEQIIINATETEVIDNTVSRNAVNYFRNHGYDLYWAIFSGFTAEFDGSSISFDRDPDPIPGT